MNRNPDLSELESLVGYRLKRAFMRIHEDVRLILEERGLTQRSFSVLSAIAGNPDVQQIDVARALGIERSGTVAIVDQLETAGLISRCVMEKDRRAQALRVTEKGLSLHRETLVALHGYEDALFDGEQETGRERLNAQLARIASCSTQKPA